MPLLSIYDQIDNLKQLKLLPYFELLYLNDKDRKRMLTLKLKKNKFKKPIVRFLKLK